MPQKILFLMTLLIYQYKTVTQDIIIWKTNVLEANDLVKNFAINWCLEVWSTKYQVLTNPELDKKLFFFFQ